MVEASDTIKFEVVNSEDHKQEENKGEKIDVNPKVPLNWKEFLHDDDILTDALAFKKWDKNLSFPFEQILRNDLTRTRSNDPFFQRESTRKNLCLLATFYCKSNNVNYQQGLLELVIPFLLLRSQTFKLAKCYAYFNSFMKKCFKNILTQRTVENNLELPHCLSAIHFCELLLSYHDSTIMNIFIKMEIDIKLFVTPWLMTLFAKGTPINLVYLIFDKYIRKRKILYLFYLITSMIVIKRKEILRMAEDGDESVLILYLNQNMKSLSSEADIHDWLKMADEIDANTPVSFETYVKFTGFTETTILSIQEIKTLLSINSQRVMPVYPFEILDWLEPKAGKGSLEGDSIEKGSREKGAKEKELLDRGGIDKGSVEKGSQQKDGKEKGTPPKGAAGERSQEKTGRTSPNFMLVDCRSNKSGEPLPHSLLIPEEAHEKELVLEIYVKMLLELDVQVHLCFIVSNEEKKNSEMTLVNELIKRLKEKNRNFISFLEGGYEAFKQEKSKVEKELGRQNKNEEEGGGSFKRFLKKLADIF